MAYASTKCPYHNPRAARAPRVRARRWRAASVRLLVHRRILGCRPICLSVPSATLSLSLRAGAAGSSNPSSNLNSGCYSIPSGDELYWPKDRIYSCGGQSSTSGGGSSIPTSVSNLSSASCSSSAARQPLPGSLGSLGSLDEDSTGLEQRTAELESCFGRGTVRTTPPVMDTGPATPDRSPIASQMSLHVSPPASEGAMQAGSSEQREEHVEGGGKSGASSSSSSEGREEVDVT